MWWLNMSSEFLVAIWGSIYEDNAPMWKKKNTFNFWLKKNSKNQILTSTIITTLFKNTGEKMNEK